MYPYDYIIDWERFKETQLPLMKDFRNSLNQEDITEEDYEHAQKVWKTFNIGQYHDLYVQSDTLYTLMYLKTLEKHVKRNIN